ncbi:nucleic acid/nucleotide deaminase domain-containing protein [Streptomyces sp. NPDC091266]|uniref:nucleic acid/nucleotide deaminase domain-containing protein n=1 Tax=Streptomyces sp. NPDC091266 TaxID=3365978 RepID=UPI003826049F
MAALEGEMRSFGQTVGDPLSTPGSVRRLEEVAVPWQVGPYFSTAAEAPVLLSAYAEAVGREVASAEHRPWARLGSDRGMELCSDAHGVVRGVLLDYDEPARYVNASPEAFAQSLLVLDRALQAIVGADQPHVAAEAFADAEQRLRDLDASAFAERESWWPLVLDDIRDTASGEWYAAFEYAGADGQSQIVTRAGAIALHPEERLWSALSGSGVEADQVFKVHTELEPCFMPGHYCSLWLAQTFPDAEMTHNFPYGETAESRAEGLRLLAEAAAQPPQQ